MVEWRLNRGVTSQTEAFLKGLFEVVEPSWLQVFDERELEVGFQAPPLLESASVNIMMPTGCHLEFMV